MRSSISRLFAVLLVFATGSAEAQNDSKNTASKGHLVEALPIVDSIEIKKGERFVEVYVTGRIASACYDVHEYQVNRNPEITRIIPRFSRSKADLPCTSESLRSFHEKAADLDPENPASFKVEVLGSYGWQKQSLKN